MFRKTIRFFSSWQLTLLLFLFFGVAYMFFTFGENSYQRWVRFVLHTPLGLSAYIALVGNVLFRSFRITYTRLRAKAATPDRIRQMDANVGIPLHEPSFEEIDAWMRGKGFEPVNSENGLHSMKGRFSFLPGTVMRTGLIVLMVSLLFSAHLRKSEEVILHEGDERVLFGKKVSLSKISPNLPDEFLQVGEEGSFRLGRVSVMLSASGKTYEVTPGFPARLNGVYCRVTHLGFSHPLSAATPGGRVARTVDLDVLPPGKSSTVALTPDGAALSFTLHPEKTITKGLLKGKQFNLFKPLYHVVNQSEKKEGSGGFMVRSEESTSGKDSVHLGKKSFFVKLHYIHDPALLWIYIGVVLTLIGAGLMFSRFFWYEKEMAAAFLNNVLYIGYREEFYKKWGIQKFYRWMDERMGK